eukprot:16445210-Heterocapsa_arctica.AAC.1
MSLITCCLCLGLAGLGPASGSPAPAGAGKELLPLLACGNRSCHRTCTDGAGPSAVISSGDISSGIGARGALGGTGLTFLRLRPT